jgi:hypothetical protein
MLPSAYYYALIAHFSDWKYPDKQWKWIVNNLLLYGQLVKWRNKCKHDGQSFTFTLYDVGEVCSPATASP